MDARGSIEQKEVGLLANGGDAMRARGEFNPEVEPKIPLSEAGIDKNLANEARRRAGVSHQDCPPHLLAVTYSQPASRNVGYPQARRLLPSLVTVGLLPSRLRAVRRSSR